MQFRPKRSFRALQLQSRFQSPPNDFLFCERVIVRKTLGSTQNRDYCTPTQRRSKKSQFFQNRTILVVNSVSRDTKHDQTRQTGSNCTSVEFSLFGKPSGCHRRGRNARRSCRRFGRSSRATTGCTSCVSAHTLSTGTY